MYERFAGIDESGNQYFVNQVGQVYLKLASEGQNRMIGQLSYISNGSYRYIKKQKSENILRKAHSFGINWHILSNLGENGWVKLYDEDGRTWEISAKDALEKGSFLYFKEGGFEKQYFIDVKEFKKTRV